MLSFPKATDPFDLVLVPSQGATHTYHLGTIVRDEEPSPLTYPAFWVSRERANFWKWVSAERYGSLAAIRPWYLCLFQAMLRIQFSASSLRTEVACTTWREVFRTLDQESRLFGHGHVTSKLHQNRLRPRRTLVERLRNLLGVWNCSWFARSNRSTQ